MTNQKDLSPAAKKVKVNLDKEYAGDLKKPLKELLQNDPDFSLIDEEPVILLNKIATGQSSDPVTDAQAIVEFADRKIAELETRDLATEDKTILKNFYNRLKRNNLPEEYL